jgi:hypothetical protein
MRRLPFMPPQPAPSPGHLGDLLPHGRPGVGNWPSGTEVNGYSFLQSNGVNLPRNSSEGG